MWRRKIGPLEVNFRVLLEPKGLLRIIILVLAILAFSLTAGFRSSDNTEKCTDEVNSTVTIRLKFAYPFHSEDFDIVYPSANISNSTSNPSEVTCKADFKKNYNGGSEFFVAMGVLSMLYSLGSLPVYMVFLNDQWSYAKWIANIDFFASVLFSFVYLIADIVWSVQTAALKNYIDDELRSRSVCLEDICTGETIHSTDSFLQLDVSLVFGWLTTFTLTAILVFLIKDTTFFHDPKAPWANYYRKKQADAGLPSGAQQNPIQGEAGNQNVVPHPIVETTSGENTDP